MCVCVCNGHGLEKGFILAYFFSILFRKKLKNFKWNSEKYVSMINVQTAANIFPIIFNNFPRFAMKHSLAETEWIEWTQPFICQTYSLKGSQNRVFEILIKVRFPFYFLIYPFDDEAILPIHLSAGLKIGFFWSRRGRPELVQDKKLATLQWIEDQTLPNISRFL